MNELLNHWNVFEILESEWMSKWLNEWGNELMDEFIHEWMNELSDGGNISWINACMDECDKKKILKKKTKKNVKEHLVRADF